MIEYTYMQKFILFILFILTLGLVLFLYLLREGYISKEDFNMKKFRGDTGFILKKNEDSVSDIYAYIGDNEYKVFTFEGTDFDTLFGYQYTDKKYKVPVNALDAVTGTWVGNRYVFYIIKKGVNYEIYKTEYPTDSPDKIEYFKIKEIDLNVYTNTNKVEIKY